MKKLLLFALLLGTVVAFSSCQKDEPEPSYPPAKPGTITTGGLTY